MKPDSKSLKKSKKSDLKVLIIKKNDVKNQEHRYGFLYTEGNY